MRRGMPAGRTVLLAMLAAVTVAATTGRAAADGFGVIGSAPSVETGDSASRYVALSPAAEPRVTVVERIGTADGRIDRWWYLRGNYYVPAVAYDRSGGGLSADGRTLVLGRFTRAFAPRRTRFAVLRTDLFLRHPRRPGSPRPEHAITRVELPGMYSFDAISPDGSKIYLIHTFVSHGRPTPRYEVRTFDLAAGRLLPEPIVDPEEPDERMQGLPVSRAAGPDGRWAYTLYSPFGRGGETFVHALDTVRGEAVCVDLPQLEDRRDQFMLRLRLDGGSDRLVVLGRRQAETGAINAAGPRHPVLEIDTESFAVSRPQPVATAAGGSVPWLPVGVAGGVLAALSIWLLVRLGRQVGED